MRREGEKGAKINSEGAKFRDGAGDLSDRWYNKNRYGDHKMKRPVKGTSSRPREKGRRGDWDGKGAVEGPASGGNLNDNAEENVGDRDSTAVAEKLDYPVSEANEIGKKARK